MTYPIINAAPMVIDLGTRDVSTRQVPRELETIPQHLPKFYLYAQKGPTTPQLVVGNERQLMYGEETFDLNSKYANHATVFANAVNAQGNACMIERVVPEDAGPKSVIVAYLDVLGTNTTLADVPLYVRDTNGFYTLDGYGELATSGTTPGFSYQWSVETREDSDFDDIASIPTETGNLTGTSEGENITSTRYPIFAIEASHFGSYGNNIGIRLWAPNSVSDTINYSLLETSKVYPYKMSVMRRASADSTAKTVNTILGDIDVIISFKENTVDTLTGQRVNILENFIPSYQNLADIRYPIKYGDFGAIHVYSGYIETLLGWFTEREYDYSGDGITNIDTDHPHLFNFISGKGPNGVPYYTFVSDPVQSFFEKDYNIWAGGGADGTMADADFADLVSTKMEDYADPDHQVQELAINVESILYDSGFPAPTKFDLCKFISTRHDTFVVLGTHTAACTPLSSAEEISLASSLRSHLELYPESDYFGTKVMRGLIMGRSGKLRNSAYVDYVPTTLEIAVKAARYMGSGDGRWKNGFNFDSAPNNILDSLYDINITWVPATVRNRNWDAGLNWVQAYDRKSYMFPALKTAYTDDTSVLTNFITVMAVCQLNKIAHAAWRNFTGVSTLSDLQLIEAINTFISRRANGIFDNRFVIEPDTYISEMDALRGFSFTCPIRIYAANMKTVATVFIEAHRLSDATTA